MPVKPRVASAQFYRLDQHMPSALPPETRERLARALRERVMVRFPDPERAQSDAARALKLSPSVINRLLHGSGGSLDTIRAVSRYLNEPPDRILWGEEAKDPVVRKLRDLPGFAEAMPEAVRRATLEHPGISTENLETAADTRAVPEPARVTAGLLIHIALAMAPNGEGGGTPSRKPKRKH